MVVPAEGRHPRAGTPPAGAALRAARVPSSLRTTIVLGLLFCFIAPGLASAASTSVAAGVEGGGVLLAEPVFSMFIGSKRDASNCVTWSGTALEMILEFEGVVVAQGPLGRAVESDHVRLTANQWSGYVQVCKNAQNVRYLGFDGEAALVRAQSVS